MSPQPAAPDRDVTVPRPGAAHRVHLAASGVSVLLDVTDGRVPAIAHWGRALGALGPEGMDALCEATVPPVPQNLVDVPVRVGLLPQVSDGWLGRPGLAGSRPDGSGWTPRLITRGLRVDGTPLADAHAETGAAQVEIDLEDPEEGLAVLLELELLPTGLLRLRARLTNTGTDPYRLDELTLSLPVPATADELLDFAGRWTKERTPQRRAFTVGTHLRENRRGRTGADSAHLLHAGRPGFGFREGEVWAVHTAFSGNHRHLAERTSSDQRLLGGGELLLPGEVALEQGGTYEGPWLYASYGDGLDQVAARFHRHLRSRPHHVDARRPVTLNVWEAVYFDHDLERLTDLADRAAALGVERFVLDDGWFGSRRDDTSGLGDWVVSPEVWPDGLGPLVDHVRAHGMEFGLWFEPEMVSEDSDVARAHPEWIMAPSPERMPLRSRNQQVLNLSIPEAYAHVRDQMLALLGAHEIGYIKWDQNRDLLESATRATGRAAVHDQTRAAYRLMDELRAAHPAWRSRPAPRAGRVWTSACSSTPTGCGSRTASTLERQQMHRWTSQLIPLELMGSHIASGRSHTTGRLHTLGFRAHSALMGHLGIEWDLAAASEEELTELTAWITLYKERRELLFTGDLVRADRGESPLWLQGVVSSERDEALFALSAVGRADTAQHPRLVLPGLDPAAAYRVRALLPSGPPSHLTPPPWLSRVLEADGAVLPGAALAVAGLAAPLLDPEQGLLLSLTRESAAGASR